MRSSPPTASGSSPATQASRANAVCERMIGTLRRELLDRILILNERHLRWILTIYLHHFNTAPSGNSHRSRLTPVCAAVAEQDSRRYARPIPPATRHEERDRLRWLERSTA
jgi:hypothetical protein